MQKVKLKLCRALTGSSLSHCIQPIDQSTTKSVMHCRCSVRPMIGFQLPGITAFWPVPNCTVSPESHQEANTQSPSGNFNVLIISLPPHTHLKDPLGILEFCLLQFYYNLYWGCSNDSTMNHVVSICWLTKFEVVCNQRGKWQCTQAPCGPQVCKNRACSISGPEVVMGIPNQGMLGQFLYFSFVFRVYVVFCVIVFGCQYQCNRLPGKTRLQNDVSCVEWEVKPYTLTHAMHSTGRRVRSDCSIREMNEDFVDNCHTVPWHIFRSLEPH